MNRPGTNLYATDSQVQGTNDDAQVSKLLSDSEPQGGRRDPSQLHERKLSADKDEVNRLIVALNLVSP